MGKNDTVLKTLSYHLDFFQTCFRRASANAVGRVRWPEEPEVSQVKGSEWHKLILLATHVTPSHGLLWMDSMHRDAQRFSVSHATAATNTDQQVILVLGLH